MMMAGMLMLSALVGTGSVQAALFSDEAETPWQEAAVTLPERVHLTALQSFAMGAAEKRHFFVDLDSIQVGRDGVVRYVLVVDSAQGARTITYEGIQCEQYRYRRYAAAFDGQSDWHPLKNQIWRPIDIHAAGRPQHTLAEAFFCDYHLGPYPHEDILRRLKRLPIPHVHPFSDN